MDTKHQSPSLWGLIHREVLWRVFCFALGENRSNKLASFKLVNKHWCDTVREYTKSLKPRNDRPFSLSRDLNAICRLEDLNTVVVDDKDAEDIQEVDTNNLQELKWLRRVKISKARMESVLALMQCAPLLTHLSLEKPRFPLANIWKQLNDQQSLKWLQLEGNVDASVDTLPSLELLELERLDVKRTMCSSGFLGKIARHSQQLRMLRVSVAGLSPIDLSILHGMKNMTSLVLDGTLEDDVFDPSSFPRLKHLAFSCRRMPQGIKDVSTLTSLGLETWDRLNNPEVLKAVYSIVERLGDLDLHLPAVHRNKVSDVLSYGVQLKKLKIKNHRLAAVDISWLRNLEELDISMTRHLRRSKRKLLMQSMARLTNLKTLMIDLNGPINLCHIFYEELDTPNMRLRKFAAKNLVLDGILSISCSGQVLRDLHLSDFTFDATMITGVWYMYLKRMKNLCFSQCRWKRGMEEEMMQLMEWKQLPRLQHLALPTECFSPENIHIIDKIRVKAPNLLLDDNPDWSPIDFRM